MSHTLEKKVVIVLGAGALRFESRRRAKHAAEIAKNGNYTVIASGCGHRLPFIGEFVEADDIAEELIRNGIRAENIVREQKSWSTYTNLEYSKAEFGNAKEGEIVTGVAHSKRVGRYAEEVFPREQGYNFRVNAAPMRTVRDYAIEALTWLWERACRCHKKHGVNYYLSGKAFGA